MRRILVIDDEKPIRTLLRIALEEAGYDVSEAATAEAAVALYEARPADLVITDLFMPEADAPAKILQLSCSHPGLKLIVLSGAAGQESAMALAKLFGARQIMEKPFVLKELLQAVQYQLAGS